MMVDPGASSAGFTAAVVPAAISFVQVASATPQTPTATVSVSYPGPQALGDLNIVVVGWNDTTATVQSVTDSAGNKYSLAIGPTSGTALQQSIYYATTIAGGSNTVTVTFSQAAAYPDIRILEYSGVTALDVAAGASGSSMSASSGPATTTSANELIFGANTVATLTEAAGSGFTARIITSPDSDLAEDLITTAAGSNAATATLTSATPWVMQMATFAATTAPVLTPSLAVSPTSLTFGSVTDGSSATLPVSLTSIGTAPVAIDSATISGSGYTFTGATFPVTLNPQLAITLEITFAPTNAGFDPGTLTISSNSSSNPMATVSLSGTGQSALYEVDLTWNAPTNSTDPVVGYNIYRATGSSSSYQLLNSSVNDPTSYRDATVQNGTVYTYYVVSVDAQGNQSLPSSTVSVTIP